MINSNTSVRIHFRPYDRYAVQKLLANVHKEFKQSEKRERWSWSVADLEAENNAWIIDFHWRDPTDAMIFALKYQR